MPTANPRPGSILGTRVTRTEDPGLLTGARKYLADLPLVDRLHAVFVRSDVAHGVLGADPRRRCARRCPASSPCSPPTTLGVAPHHGFVHRARRLRPRRRWPPTGCASSANRSPSCSPRRRSQASDAADAVWADYDPLPAVVDPEDAFDDDAPTASSSRTAPTRPSARRSGASTDLAGADHVVRGRYVNQRIAVVPMEPDCCGGRGRRRRPADVLGIDADAPRRCTGSSPAALGMDRADVRVVTPQVGGGFGGKAGIYPEYSVVAAAAGCARPARSSGSPTRSEDMAGAAAQPRPGPVRRARLPATTGRSPACACASSATPAPTRAIGAFLPGGTERMSNGTYDFPAIQFDVAVAVTNTTPTGAYRGAGRPEATALLERAGRPGRARARHRPDRAAPRNLLGRRRVPVHDAHRRHLRHRPLRAPARRAPPTSSATTSCAPSSAHRRDAGDRDAARHRRRGLRRDHRRRRRRRVRRASRSTTTARRPCIAGTLVARAGPPDGVRHDRLRPAPASRSTGSRLVDGDTDLVRTRRRHRRVALAAARRLGRARRHRGDGRQGQAARRPRCSRPTSPTSSSTPSPAPIGVAGVPAHGARRGRELRHAGRRAIDRPRHALGRRARLPPGRRHVPVRRPHRRRRGRPRHRQGHAAAPRRGRRLRHRAQPAARRGPAARRHRRRHRPGAVRGGPLRRRRQPDHRRTSPTTRIAVGRRAARRSRSTPPRPRRRSTRSAPRASARPPRSARRRRCRTR